MAKIKTAVKRVAKTVSKPAEKPAAPTEVKSLYQNLKECDSLDEVLELMGKDATKSALDEYFGIAEPRKDNPKGYKFHLRQLCGIIARKNESKG